MTNEHKLREALSEDVVLRLVYRHFSQVTYKYLLTDKWKDGIDIYVPSRELLNFLQDIYKALSEPQIQAHSKSEYKRLEAMGANVTSDEGTPLTDALSERFDEDWHREVLSDNEAAKLSAKHCDEAMAHASTLERTLHATKRELAAMTAHYEAAHSELRRCNHDLTCCRDIANGLREELKAFRNASENSDHPSYRPPYPAHRAGYDALLAATPQPTALPSVSAAPQEELLTNDMVNEGGRAFRELTHKLAVSRSHEAIASEIYLRMREKFPPPATPRGDGGCT